jgi:hypothetical protein
MGWFALSPPYSHAALAAFDNEDQRTAKMVGIKSRYASLVTQETIPAKVLIRRSYAH